MLNLLMIFQKIRCGRVDIYENQRAEGIGGVDPSEEVQAKEEKGRRDSVRKAARRLTQNLSGMIMKIARNGGASAGIYSLEC
jgi:hypothetical protein